MPALAADIAAATRESVTAIWSDAAIKARYPRARDDSDRPAGGYCDNLADAQTLVAARGAIIGVDRRRFTVPVADILWLDPTGGMPCVTVADAEQALTGVAMVTRAAILLGAEQTELEILK